MTDENYPGIHGNVAIVTGGAKGIGESCVRLLTQHGARVAIFDIDTVAGKALAAEIGSNCEFYTLDVSNSAAVRDAVRHVTTDLGPPTLLVNNAGIGHYGTVTETSDEDWQRVLNVNLSSYFYCAREVVPCMQTAGKGAIVNVASVQSLMSQRRVPAYCASKAGILGLSRALAVDYAPTIRSNAICPGTVDTPMLAAAVAGTSDPQALLQECRDMYLLKRIAQPSEIAHLVLYLLSGLAAFITGQVIRIDGGMGLEIGGSVRDE